MVKHIEDTHQEAVISWAKIKKLPILNYIEPNARVIEYLYSIPNGGNRNKREAARLKKQGVKSGVSDLHLALPMNGYHGLWIEMKRPIVKGKSKPVVSATQKEWLERMVLAGFKALVCYSWIEAKEAIEEYLSESELLKLVA